MLQGALENQNIGGGGFGGFGGGGFGAFGLIGLLGLDSLGRRRGEGDGVTSLDADGIAAKTALLVNQNADQNALLSAIADNKNQIIAEGRNLGDAICKAETTNLQQFYAAAIQASNNTQSIKDQASAFAIVNDNRFDAIERAGVNQTAAILARINDVENQNLRDQLFESRRFGNAKETEININNSATAVQAQLQAQQQWQVERDHENQRRFDAIFNSFNQVNRTAQDIINLGTMTASGTQATNATNIK